MVAMSPRDLWRGSDRTNRYRRVSTEWWPRLGSKTSDPTTPDYCTIKDWLRRCDDLHPITCRPSVSEGLKQIKLVDVETRQIVMYPPDDCDYISLSYVWGGVDQPGYKLGQTLPTVPATRNLGKPWRRRYRSLIRAIHSGAWATIISPSGLRSEWTATCRKSEVK